MSQTTEPASHRTPKDPQKSQKPAAQTATTRAWPHKERQSRNPFAVNPRAQGIKGKDGGKSLGKGTMPFKATGHKGGISRQGSKRG
ncbi:hypothetical protein [Bifidobacterium eulemuris]|uniref:Uncharacterized protein n=1 Tax=Bifidobacterium eulemuris TaxID=1765219 RepID=A0A261G3X5_9BIFI|nr:hypothetical protein [Bifidobacterium eulemuris]OZG65925.1 hypothetical protein BEUL_1823 [Bifidobacterium eulemuris]QOL33287.1 hypothetical protein BE0216_05565 [Bifidobacterium eulemuris]